MRAFTIPTLLLVLILAFSLWTGRYAEKRTEQLSALLEQTEAAAQREDWREAEARLRDAYGGWQESQGFFYTVMDHAQLDEAESLFAGAIAVCREEDDDDFHMLLAQLATQLRLLAETQSVSLKNIL